MKGIRSYYSSIRGEVKASIWFLVCSVMQRGVSVVTTPIFTRLMTTSQYGQYGVFNSWLDIITVFVTMRVYYGVFVQGLVKYEGDKTKYVSSMQGLLLVLCSIWTIIYIAFRDFWNSLLNLSTVQMLAMLVMIWSVGSFRFWTAEQRNQYKYKALLAVTIIVNVLKPTIGILLVIYSDDKVTARILGLALVEVVCYSWVLFYHLYRGKQFFSSIYWKHALMFNIPLIPHYLSQTVLNSADRIMISNIIGESEAGIYSVAYSLAKLMSMFTTALNQTLSPWMYKKIKAKHEKDIEKIAYTSMLGVGLLNIILIGMAPELMSMFAPKSYFEAINVIPPVAMSVFFMFAYQMFAAFEFYYEKTKYIMFASIIGACLNIILNSIFIRLFGYVAAGYTTLLCYILYCLFHYIAMRRIISKEELDKSVYSVSKVIKIFSAFLIICFILILSYKNDTIRFILVFCVAFFLFWKKRDIIDGVKDVLFIKKK